MIKKALTEKREKDHVKRFKKTVRIKEQNEKWNKLEAEGGIVREWYRNTVKSNKKILKKPVLKKAPKKKTSKKKTSKKGK